MSDMKKRIALLIDADNASATTIERILESLKRHGSVDVRRAYGNSENLRGWKAACDKHAIDAVQPVSSGRNATDIKMVIGAMDLHHSGSLDVFALVSSDADFTPLAERLRQDGVEVYGFDDNQTSKALRDACTTVLKARVYEPPKRKQLKKSSAAPVKPKTPVRNEEKLRGNTQLHQRLRGAVDATKAKSGWSHLARVRNHIGTESFDQRTYGFRRFGALMEATGLFEIRRSGKLAQVRAKPTA